VSLRSIIGPDYSAGVALLSTVHRFWWVFRSNIRARSNRVNHHDWLTPKLTARRPHAAVRLQAEPPPGGDAVARQVRPLLYQVLIF